MLIPVAFVFIVSSVAGTLDPDAGHPCGPGENGTAPGIKFFYDEDRMKSYPFFYHGCGGNENRDDYKNVIVDYAPCPGFGKGKGQCGRSDNEEGPGKTCEKGYFCNPSLFTGECCSEEDGIKDNEDRLTKCPPGSKGVQIESEIGSYKYPLFGKSCAHNFCQEGATCVQGHFHAYCCLN